jgi:PadR family transcriptional regulator, regulatory protein PadR
LLASEWGVSENYRRARYCRLTPAGRRRLREATEEWDRTTAAMAAALGATASEV